MKEKIKWALVTVAFIVPVACSTVPPAQREDRVTELFLELQTADQERLMELSARPFLLDGEIIVRERDIMTMWENLTAAGFRFDGAMIRSVEPVSPDSYGGFADTMDVQVFFDRYLPEGAGMVVIDTEIGSFLVLTGERIRRVPQLVGFTGPQS